MRPVYPSKAPSSPISPQPSPWHSPVPYLFGGLAAMLGLIAFALLVLACSYWKLSGHFENDNRDIDSESRNEDGTSPPEHDNDEKLADMQEKYFVIMAGENKPTFLATPISSRTTSFGSSSWRSDLSVVTDKSSASEMEENKESTNHL